MAYRDENGTITIDEIAAAKDIKRITEAIAILEESRRTLSKLSKHAATDGKGKTAAAAEAVSNELIKRINAMISNLNETKAFIKKTVEHYQYLDQQIKAIIKAKEAFDNGN